MSSQDPIPKIVYITFPVAVFLFFALATDPAPPSSVGDAVLEQDLEEIILLHVFIWSYFIVTGVLGLTRGNEYVGAMAFLSWLAIIFSTGGTVIYWAHSIWPEPLETAGGGVTALAVLIFFIAAVLSAIFALGFVFTVEETISETPFLEY